MIRRRQWATIPAFVAVASAVAAFAAYQGASSQQAPAPKTPSDTVITHDPGPGPWGYHGASSPQGYSPVQPIRFPHPKHVKGLGMNCVYCHFAAYKSSDPGLPAVGTCMGCHQFTFTLANKPRDREADELLEQEAAHPAVDSDPPAAGVRPLPAHAARQCRHHVPDLSRTDPGDVRRSTSTPR